MRLLSRRLTNAPSVKYIKSEDQDLRRVSSKLPKQDKGKISKTLSSLRGRF